MDLTAGEVNPSEKAIKRQELLAKTFRELMTKGQAFKEVNDFRRLFFDDIIDEVGFHSFPCHTG
jgi:hypothetical protein